MWIAFLRLLLAALTHRPGKLPVIYSETVLHFGKFSLHNEMDSLSRKPVLKVERAQETDTVNLENKSVVTSPVSPTSQPNSTSGGRLHTKREQRSGNTLYQELSFQVKPSTF